MVKEKNPGAALTEVAKKCGEEWRALGEGAKKKYEKKQEEAKKKFDKEYKVCQEYKPVIFYCYRITIQVWLENGGEEALKQAKKETQEKKDKKALADGNWPQETGRRII